MAKSQKREVALQKFLAKRENKKEVVGALVCGSYITGNPTKRSDIDLHILLKKGTKWRERGNEIIDGILIEYFANTFASNLTSLENDFKTRRRVMPHMFASGKVLFDKTGELKKLIAIAKKQDAKKFAKPDKVSNESVKYSLWDMLDNLEEVYEKKDDDFYFVYYNNLNTLFENYAKFMQFETLKAHKTKQFLHDKHAIKKYDVSVFPDKKFTKHFIKALNLDDKHKMMKKIKRLTKHVLDKMGGFEIDGRKLRSVVK